VATTAQKRLQTECSRRDLLRPWEIATMRLNAPFRVHDATLPPSDPATEAAFAQWGNRP